MSYVVVRRRWRLVAAPLALMMLLLVHRAFSADVAEASTTRFTNASTSVKMPGIGVQYHAMWSDYTDAQRIAVFDKLQDAGVKWLRVDMGWSSFQENGPNSYSQWYIDRAEFVVNEARERGMQLLITLWRTPHWENGADVIDPPKNPANFGKFCGWFAARFKGRVAAYEIWNEPNLDSFWGGDAKDYADILKASYGPIKQADPAAKVLVGGPAYNDTNWLKAIYAHGIHGYFDAMATHPYQAPTDLPPETPDPTGTNIWLISHVASVYKLMQSYGDGDKKIWFTEYGWSTHANSPGQLNWERGVTYEQQADYYVRAIKFVASNYPYVEAMFWYDERNDASGNIQVDNYGILHRDLSPKPVYWAMKEFLASGWVPGVPVPSTSAKFTVQRTPDGKEIGPYVLSAVDDRFKKIFLDNSAPGVTVVIRRQPAGTSLKGLQTPPPHARHWFYIQRLPDGMMIGPFPFADLAWRVDTIFKKNLSDGVSVAIRRA